MLQKYLQKFSKRPKLISSTPNNDTGIIVIIPSYNEHNLINSLQSLKECTMLNFTVEIILVLNHAINASPEIKRFHELQFEQLKEYKFEFDTDQLILLLILIPDMEVKHAGVGLARKIGMDEAVRRFHDIQKENGILLSFDADCLCSKNYFEKVYTYFQQPDSKPAVNIGFKHLTADLGEDHKIAILSYEIHLRYYIETQKYCNYPFAYQAIGSCFAITAKAYTLQGGMNTKQAGEDFYFLHKYSTTNALGEISDVLVYPSARISERVPFGTGKAMMDVLSKNKNFKTYSFEGIQVFCKFFHELDQFYGLGATEIVSLFQRYPNPFVEYLYQIQFPIIILQCNENSVTKKSFLKQIQQRLHPFVLMKWLHFAETRGYSTITIYEACQKFLEPTTPTNSPSMDNLEKNLAEFEAMSHLGK
ncbi:MAG: glycosyltransferase family 2 protein [Bacteroidota bacterium]|nr:glycosyltransferase family 2 protein [Bacteroidota bacterium]